MKRYQIEKRTSFGEDGKKVYHYTYEYRDAEGNVKATRQMCTRTTPKYATHYSTKEHEEIVLGCINDFIKTNEIHVPHLYKKKNLEPHLKPLCGNIWQTHQIRITQDDLRNLIKTKILLL